MGSHAPKFIWTRAKELELATRYVAGEDVDALAESIGCTRSALTSRLSMLGIRRRKLKAEPVIHGNLHWMAGHALRTAIPVSSDSFGEDLLSQIE